MPYFADYDMIAQSALFDRDFYRRENPDVDLGRHDPVAHFLEIGAGLGRDPGPEFDTAYYLAQCDALGERPANALAHFLTKGADLGLTIRAPVATATATANPNTGFVVGEGLAMSLDAPAIASGLAVASIGRSLPILGWALARDGIDRVEIAVDGQWITDADHGVRRDDVAAAFPDFAGSLLSGFSALLPKRALPPGQRKISIVARDKAGASLSFDFAVQIEGPEEAEPGPWSLRRRMPESEVELGERVLEKMNWRPAFALLLRTGASDEAIAAARLTLLSLREQAYGDWRLAIAPSAPGATLDGLKDRMLRGFEDISDRVSWVGVGAHDRSLDQVLAATTGRNELFGVLAGGDELGVDALLAFATWTARRQDVDLIYCDERRVNPATGKIEAFFKPDWSPDLALSTNYIGRLWFMTASLLREASVTLAELASLGEYDLVLRCAEQANAIGHLPTVLYQRSPADAESPELERAALERGLRRRNIDGRVVYGHAPGYYQVDRTHGVTGLVSVVIPTRGSRGLIKTCIETLRERTLYRNFEIVCIENIPSAEASWRTWLSANVDQVVSTTEPFNWSRFNNIAAARAKGEYLVFLNDDIEIVSPDWLDVLLGHAIRPEVGVVGPLLLYPDLSVQHAGLFLSRLGTARHAFRFLQKDDPGYFGLALCERDVIGVTGACLMVRRDVYDRVGRFDEAHTVINNDVDFCLKIHEQGLLTVFTPRATLIHHELASRGDIPEHYHSAAFDARWSEVFLRGDPYYSPHLSRHHDDYEVEREPVRVVYPSHPLIARENVRRVLLLKIDHIGDCVTALPAVRHLRALFPEARFSILAAPSTKAIWALTDDIDEVIPFEFFHARSADGPIERTGARLAALGEQLAPHRFDLAIDLRKSPDSRHLLRSTGARYLAGFSHQTDFPWLDISLEWEGDPKFHGKHAHISDDLLRLVHAVELACQKDRTVLTPVGGPSPLPAELARRLHAKPVVAIHPAAGTPTREWPAASFAQLIDLLVRDFDVNIAIIGGKGDQAVADAILAATAHGDRVTSLLGDISLEQLAKFLPACALFVGNNSGPSHLAAALGMPTVAVHSGVIASEEWGPQGPLGVAIRRDMVCAPCYISKPEECHRGLACLTRLTAGEVFAVCRQFLSQASAARV